MIYLKKYIYTSFNAMPSFVKNFSFDYLFPVFVAPVRL